MEKIHLENAVEGSLENQEQNIPGFEHLSEKDKKFVLEIKHLGEISEDEFFQENPKLARLKLKKLKMKDEPYRLVWLGFQSLKSVRVENMEDAPYYWTTMWELLKLHLLELEDFRKFGPGFYGKQTAFLANQIVERMADDPPPLPDAYGGPTGSRIKFKEIPHETKDQLSRIHWYLTIHHEHSSLDGRLPPCLDGIRDLWRYVVLHTSRNPMRPAYLRWNDVERQFLDQLSNISWKEDIKK